MSSEDDVAGAKASFRQSALEAAPGGFPPPALQAVASVLRQRYSFPTRQFTDTTLEETLEACC